jgi:hypothetical protein
MNVDEGEKECPDKGVARLAGFSSFSALLLQPGPDATLYRIVQYNMF